MIIVFLKDLILQIIAGILGLWLACEFISGVEITGSSVTLIWAGLILGLMNFFIKPVLNLISLPLRILTLGLFGLVINMALIWAVDIMFSELTISGIIALFWTTAIIWVLSIILPKFLPKKKATVEKL